MHEHLIAKDSVSYLWCVDEVHLQQTCLQVTLLWLVLFQSIQQTLLSAGAIHG